MASTTWGGADRGYDMSLWYDSRPLKIGWFTMLAAVGAEVVFQRVFGYSHGLDSMTPEFENVWMGLWRFNVISNIIFSVSTLGWLWSTRDRNVANVDPKTELKRYFYWMMWLAVYVFGVYWAGSYTLEQDASWHQVIIRDTSFTASHIIAFYFTFPLYITCGVASYLYAMTRLPQFSKAVSFPLVGAIVGPMMILPNVGLNEWGHAFWFVDELFAAPLHWGFVTLGWCG
ncbi:MAG: bacterial ammonia monooxygenase, subunit AmoC, partial [Nitrospiraceae bacterium]